MSDFENTFLGAIAGAGAAFLLAYVRDRLDAQQEQKRALFEAQVAIEYQIRSLKAYMNGWIRKAQEEAQTPFWSVRIPSLIGSSAERIDTARLGFLLDPRFSRLVPFSPDAYQNIVESQRSHASAEDSIEALNSLKDALLPHVSPTAKSMDTLASEAVQESTVHSEGRTALVQLQTSAEDLAESLPLYVRDLERAEKELARVLLYRWQIRTSCTCE